MNAQKIKMNAKKREELGKKVKEGRTEGLLPAVVYGHGTANQNIWIDALEFEKVLNAAGESTLIELAVDGEKGKHNVLIHDVQLTPKRNVPMHCDLFEVRMDEEVQAGVPLTFVGEAPIVKESGGTLVKAMDEVEVKALPNDLPHDLEVDLSVLKTFEDHITVSQIKRPKGVEIVEDSEAIVASVSEPRTEEETTEEKELEENATEESKESPAEDEKKGE